MTNIKNFFKKHLKNICRSLTILLILVPMVVVYSNSVAPPYHQFTVTGEIEREGGGSRENFVVVVLVKPLWLGTDSLRTYKIFYPDIDYEKRLRSTPMALTDQDGAFWLQIKSVQPIDSITAAVFFPDQMFITGDTLCVGDLRMSALTYRIRSDGGGCCASPVQSNELYTEAYIYEVPEQKITIP